MTDLEPIVLDFETAFSTKDKLGFKHQTTVEYVRDPRFAIHGAGLFRPTSSAAPIYYERADLNDVLADIDWRDIDLIAHNHLFDGFVLSEKHHIRPARRSCTLAMSEAVFQGETASSLNAVATRLGFGVKSDDVKWADGLFDLTPEQQERMGTYCVHDTLLAWQIYQALVGKLPPLERQILSITLGLFCEPVLGVDLELAHQALHEAKRDVEEAIARTGHSLSEIRSRKQFPELLRALGVEPPGSFAKTNAEMIELQGHRDERVRNLVTAKLRASSTIDASRAARMISIGQSGTLPICLHYHRAHTGRWSGGDKMNPQNLRRGGALRKAILAPKGHVLVVVDSSQIECRTNAELAGEDYLLQIFRDGRDPYAEQASLIYKRPITKADVIERFVGKVAVLGLGFGMGAPTFQRTLNTGAMGDPVFLDNPEDYANVVNVYRYTNLGIVAQWERCNSWIRHLAFGDKPLEHRYLTIDPQNNRIWLPSGRALYYPDLQCSHAQFTYGPHRTKIYGGLLTENIVQALARDIVAWQLALIAERYRVVMTTHDEVVALVPEAEADEAFEWMSAIMRTPPSWIPNIPLDCEGGYDIRYSK